MKHGAIYCRVSTEEQKERQSINNQIDFAKEYCIREGYIPYSYYLDDGDSGLAVKTPIIRIS